MKILIPIFFTLISFNTLAQIEVSGYVRSKEDSTAVPGVNVSEKGSTNGTSTDADGKFKLSSRYTKPMLLSFSFIGLKTIEIKVTSDTILNVALELDSEQLNEPTYCYCGPRAYTGIGYSGGVRYTPLGFNISNSLPYFFNFPLLLTSEFTYRTDQEDNYLINASIKRNNRIGPVEFNLGADYLESEIYTTSNEWRFKEINLFSEIRVYRFWLIAGAGKQEYKKGDILLTNMGTQLGIRKYIAPLRLTVTTVGKYWDDYWQAELGLMTQIKSFDLGVRGVVIDDYKEVELLLRYKFFY